MSILDSTYSLCKYIKNSEYSGSLKDVVGKLNRSTNHNIDDGHFGYVARHHTLQFLSYLYVNENYEKMNRLMAPFKLTPLNSQDVILFEKGHNLILNINKLIRDYLTQILPNSGDSIDIYRKVKTKITSNHIVDIPYSYIEEISKNFYGHRSLVTIKKAVTNFPKLKELPKDQISMGVELLLSEINRSDLFEVPTGIRDMNHMLPQGHIGENINITLRALSCLRVSLKVLNQIIYQAAKREKLAVLDNSNVSRIIDHQTYYLGEAIKLEVQPNHKCNLLILPRSCCFVNIKQERHTTKGLFWIVNHTFSFSREYGHIETFWLRRIDDDLNYLINFNHY